MLDREYLVNFGRSGDFGRFRAADSYDRGDRVVVRIGDIVAVGTVLCPVVPGHTKFLSRSLLGDVLRAVGADDFARLHAQEIRSQAVFDHARRRAAKLGLPLEVVDVELPLEGRHAIVHYLRSFECDVRELVSDLARTFDVLVTMQNMALAAEIDDDGGCGKPDCGHGDGGCTSCSTGGGCSTCSQGMKKEEVGALLARLTEHDPTPERIALL